MSIHEDARETVVFFTATDDERPADGVLRVVGEADEPATELTLMMRPLETLLAGVKAMGRALGARPGR